MNTNPLKIGVALGGGSAWGIAHIGVLKALMDHDIMVDCIAGTSAGAIVATLFAFGIPLEEIQRKAKGLSWYSLAGLPTSGLGLTSNQPLEKMMEDLIGKADIHDAKLPLAITATDIEGGANVVFKKGRAALAVRASACIPGLFAPVDINDRKFVDGGLTENVPVSSLDAMGAELKIGVNVTHWHSERRVKNLLDVMSNAMDILATHQEARAEHRADIFIRPDLAAYSPSDFRQADALVAEGYRAALTAIPEIKALILKRGRRRGRAKQPGFWQNLKRWLAS